MADDAFKRQVLDATDIVELVSQSVALKRRGKNHVGLCPFHNERTPSFSVSAEKRYFKCFGCKASGNAIDFVMKRDRLDFLGALKLLAERAGLEWPKRGATRESISERQQLLDAHARAAGWFHANLLDPELGTPARDYLARRGFTDATIRAFQIGYAPPGWDRLLASDAMSGFTGGLLALGGLVKPKPHGTGHYDTFRDRLMFPIRDEQGRTIAFGGRVMPGSEDAAKYLNSPETPIFSKGRTVFGLDLARPRIVETRVAAIVEGYTDVAMAHQFGATHVVSVLGTAMTEQHLHTLKRFADRVVLLFDGDAAGETAVNRSIELFLSQPIEIGIATLPDGLDPDEFLLKHGLAGFDRLVSRAEDALSFKWRSLERQYQASGDNLTAQQAAAEEFLRLIASARGIGPIDPLRWGQILRRVERLTGVPIELIQQRVATLRPRRPVGVSRPDGGRVRGGSGAADSEVEHTPLTGGKRDVSCAGSAVDPASPGVGATVSEAAKRAERWILGILLARPAYWIHLQVSVSPEQFSDPRRRQLAQIYWEHQRNEGEPEFAAFLTELPTDELRTMAVDLLEECETLPDVEATLRTAVRFFEEEKRREELAALRSSLKPGQEDDSQAEVLRRLMTRVGKGDIRRTGPQ